MDRGRPAWTWQRESEVLIQFRGTVPWALQRRQEENSRSVEGDSSSNACRMPSVYRVPPAPEPLCLPSHCGVQADFADEKGKAQRCTRHPQGLTASSDRSGFESSPLGFLAGWFTFSYRPHRPGLCPGILPRTTQKQARSSRVWTATPPHLPSPHGRQCCFSCN